MKALRFARFALFAIMAGRCFIASAAEVVVKSPDDKAVVTVTDDGGLSYSVFFDGHEVVGKSRFGIVSDDVDLGANAKLGKAMPEISYARHRCRPIPRKDLNAATACPQLLRQQPVMKQEHRGGSST